MKAEKAAAKAAAALKKANQGMAKGRRGAYSGFASYSDWSGARPLGGAQRSAKAVANSPNSSRIPAVGPPCHACNEFGHVKYACPYRSRSSFMNGQKYPLNVGCMGSRVLTGEFSTELEFACESQMSEPEGSHSNPHEKFWEVDSTSGAACVKSRLSIIG